MDDNNLFNELQDGYDYLRTVDDNDYDFSVRISYEELQQIKQLQE